MRISPIELSRECASSIPSPLLSHSPASGNATTAPVRIVAARTRAPRLSSGPGSSVRLPFFYGWIVVAVALRDHGYRGTGLGRRGGARALHDRTGSYVLAFWIAIAASVVS